MTRRLLTLDELTLLLHHLRRPKCLISRSWTLEAGSMTFSRLVAGDRSSSNRILASLSLVYRSIQPTCRTSNCTTSYGARLTTISRRELELRCRYEKTWGHLFETFDLFLGCSWPVIVVTDMGTSKAHIVTKLSHIQSFIKMIRTRWVPEYIPM
jgi:hypothetical protein